MKIEVAILEKESVPLKKLTYVVMGARYGDQWIFVKHRDRVTWEMPAGHIEPGEHPDEAAEREVIEETGAEAYNLSYLLDYSVTVNGKREFGRLYFAEVQEMGPLPQYEIDQRMLSEELPRSLTYPDVQKVLFGKILDHTSK